jgi:membrane protein YdbS with pleckstrin-like domain
MDQDVAIATPPTEQTCRSQPADLLPLPSGVAPGTATHVANQLNRREQASLPVQERTVWEGSPSQLGNARFYVLSALAGLVLLPTLIGPIIPALAVLRRYLATRFTSYSLTNERLSITSGILSRKSEEMELHRLQDSRLTQSFLQRIFHISSVTLISSDKTTPTIHLHSLKDGKKVREGVRKLSEIRRRSRGVQEVEILELRR